jgi:hypothetical protein
MNFSPFKSSTYTNGIRDSSVGTVTILRAARAGFRIPAGERNYSLFQIVQTCPVVHQPPIWWVPGLFLRGKAAAA